MSASCKLTALVCLFSTSMPAAVLVQDDFNYPPGPIAGQAGGFGWELALGQRATTPAPI